MCLGQDDAEPQFARGSVAVGATGSSGRESRSLGPRTETSTNRHRCGRPLPPSAALPRRASAASARARSRSHCDRQSRGARSGTDTGDNRTPPLPSTSVKPVPKSSSRTTMRTTIAHGKSRYQQKDSTLWGLASTWEMRLTGPIPRPERTLTHDSSIPRPDGTLTPAYLSGDVWLYNESAFGTLTVDKIRFSADKEAPDNTNVYGGLYWLRGLDLNQRPSGYERDRPQALAMVFPIRSAAASTSWSATCA